MHFRDKVPQLKKVIVWDLEGLRQFEDPMVMTFDDILKLGRQVVEKEPDLSTPVWRRSALKTSLSSYTPRAQPARQRELC